MISKNWVLISLISSCLLTAQALYAVENQDEFANLSLETSTDSKGTQGRHYVASAYLDESCNKPKKNAKVFRKKYAKDVHKFNSKPIAAGRKFLFQVKYSESRRDEDRDCSYIVAFSPENGRSYKARYNVWGQTAKCSLSIVDTTDGGEVEVEHQEPEYSCAKPGTKGNRNGVPNLIVYQR